MMNLNAIANQLIQVVNPDIVAAIYKSNGWAINPDRSRSPSFSSPITMGIQVQALSQGDIQHVDNMGLQGQFISIYTNGNWCGLNRKSNEGGDVFVFNGNQWRVQSIPENWETWTRVIAVKLIEDLIL